MREALRGSLGRRYKERSKFIRINKENLKGASRDAGS